MPHDAGYTVGLSTIGYNARATVITCFSHDGRALAGEMSSTCCEWTGLHTGLDWTGINFTSFSDLEKPFDVAFVV
jgi:hypothetical protein